nr:MAG TPA: hypothetical protein [Caudoviricetes sp.]
MLLIHHCLKLNDFVFLTNVLFTTLAKHTQ